MMRIALQNLLTNLKLMMQPHLQKPGDFINASFKTKDTASLQHKALLTFPGPDKISFERCKPRCFDRCGPDTFKLL